MASLMMKKTTLSLKLNKQSLMITLLAVNAAFLAPAVSANSNSAYADSGFTGNVSGVMGSSMLNKDDWNDDDNQVMFGVIGDFKMASWPVSIALDTMLNTASEKVKKSNGKNQTLYRGVNTFQVGLRKIWQMGGTTLYPYAGGGLALTQGYQELLVNDKKDDERDDAVGSWVGAGVYWRPTKHWNVGFDMRYLDADVTLSDRDIDAGGLRYGLSTGYHW